MITGTAISREENLSRGEFFAHYYKQEPVVLAGAIAHWPAVGKWSFSYLAERYGETEVWLDYYDRSSQKSSLDHHIEWNIKKCTLRDYFNAIESGERCYSLREDRDLFEQIDALLLDLHNTEPFGNREEFFEDDYKGLWIGGAGHVTALHIDIGEGHLFHLHGEKRFVFFAPEQTVYLYEQGTEKLADKAVTAAVDDKEEIEIWRKYMRWSEVNPLEPDYKRFPLLEKATFREAILKPGDVMYVPTNWWHVVESLTPTIGVTMGVQEHLILSEAQPTDAASVAAR